MLQRLSPFISGEFVPQQQLQAGHAGSRAPALSTHPPTGRPAPVGLLEGQRKDPPCPWLLQPLSPCLTLVKGKMTQCPRSVLFPGRSQGQRTGALAGWLEPRNPSSKPSSATHSLSPWANCSPSGPPRPPNPEQGRSEPLLEAGTMVSPLAGHRGGAELLRGHTQSDTRGHSHAGRGRWGCGERAWRQGCPAGEHLRP